MQQYRIVDEFETSVSHYWSVFFDPDYNAGLYHALDMNYELLEFKRQGEGESETIFRRIRLVPRRELPSVLQKFVQGAVSYEQRDSFVRKDNRIEVQTIPNYLADRFISTGIYRVVPLANKVQRSWDGKCECRVPLVGGAIERIIIDEVERGYRTTTTFTRDWLARHPAP